MSQLLYPWYPLDTMMGGPQSWSGHGVKENSLPMPGIKPQPFSP